MSKVYLRMPLHLRRSATSSSQKIEKLTLTRICGSMTSPGLEPAGLSPVRVRNEVYVRATGRAHANQDSNRKPRWSHAF